MIAVTGSIQTRSWDGQDGKRQYSTEVVVEEAYFTGSRAETGSRSGNANGGGYQQNGYQNNSYQNGYGSAPAPSPAPNTEPNFDDFDSSGFADFDGSEDDLPF